MSPRDLMPWSGEPERPDPPEPTREPDAATWVMLALLVAMLIGAFCDSREQRVIVPSESGDAYTIVGARRAR